METSHDIFVEGKFVGEDGEMTTRDICIQDAIKSMSYERGVKPTLEKYGPAVKDLYLLLVYFPGWTKEERDGYIHEYKEEILDALKEVNIDYIDNLFVTISWEDKHYTPEQFKKHKNYVIEQIDSVLERVA